MSKIFGEEHFINNTMIDLMEDYGNKLDRIVFDEMTKTLKYTMPEVKVDEQRLRNWVVLCMKLENIDKSDLVGIAVKKKFADKNEQLAICIRALELACKRLKDLNDCPELTRKEGYLQRAKQELEEQDVKD